MGVSVRGCPWVSVGKWMQKGRSGQSRAEPRAVLAPDAVQPMAARACDSAAKSLVSVVARAWPCFVRLPFLDCHGHGCGVLAPTLFPAPPDAIGNTTMFTTLSQACHGTCLLEQGASSAPWSYSPIAFLPAIHPSPQPGIRNVERRNRKRTRKKKKTAHRTCFSQLISEPFVSTPQL